MTCWMCIDTAKQLRSRNDQADELQVGWTGGVSAYSTGTAAMAWN